MRVEQTDVVFAFAILRQEKGEREREQARKWHCIPTRSNFTRKIGFSSGTAFLLFFFFFVLIFNYRCQNCITILRTKNNTPHENEIGEEAT